MICPKEQTVTSILENQDKIVQTILVGLETEFPKLLFDKTSCARDIGLILNAVIKDFLDESVEQSTRAGLNYVYFYNGLTFTYQKAQTLYAITEIKRLVTKLGTTPEYQEQLRSKFLVILDIISDKTVKEVKIWDYVARVAPFLALAIIAVTYLIGASTLLHISIIGTIIVFFTAGVVWWWWSIYKIANIIIKIRQSQNKFKEVGQQIKDIRKEVNELHDDDSSGQR